jgi:hypothetical protein
MRTYDVLLEDLAKRAAEFQRLQDIAEQVAESFRDAFAYSLDLHEQERPLLRLRDLIFEGGEPVVTDGGGYVALPKKDEWLFVLELTLGDHRRLCRCWVHPSQHTTYLRIEGLKRYEIVPSAQDSFSEACRDLYHYLRKQVEAGTFDNR